MIQSSDAQGHDLAGTTISCSSFPRSISDGDDREKGKAEIGIVTSLTTWVVRNSSKGGRDVCALEHKKRVSVNQA